MPSIGVLSDRFSNGSRFSGSMYGSRLFAVSLTGPFIWGSD